MSDSQAWKYWGQCSYFLEVPQHRFGDQLLEIRTPYGDICLDCFGSRYPGKGWAGNEPFERLIEVPEWAEAMSPQ